MQFGPKNLDEAQVFALEELRADIQYEILRRMKEAGFSRAQLARKLGVSSAWVSQILNDDANLTLESISKVFLALDSRCVVSTEVIGADYAGSYVQEDSDGGEFDAWCRSDVDEVSGLEGRIYDFVSFFPDYYDESDLTFQDNCSSRKQNRTYAA